MVRLRSVAAIALAVVFVQLWALASAPPDASPGETGPPEAGAPETVQQLIERMGTDDFNGMDASRKLVRMGRPAVDELIGALEHPLPRVRYWSISALSSIGDDRAVPAMKKRLDDPRPIVRAVAIWHLGRWFERADVREAVLNKLDDKSTFVRGWVLKLIRSKKYSPAADRVRALLQPAAGEMAIVIQVGEEEFPARLMQDRAPKTVRAILRALPIQSTVVQRAEGICFEIPVDVQEENSERRVNKGDMGCYPADDLLCIFYRGTALPSGQEGPASAVVIVGRTDNPDGLQKHADGEPATIRSAAQPEVRYDALHTLAILQGPDALDAMRQALLNDWSSLVRESALRCTTVIEPRTPRVGELLITGLGDTDEGVRKVAVELLRKGFGQYFAFDASAEPVQRERAAGQWRAWYETHKDELRWSEQSRRFEIPE